MGGLVIGSYVTGMDFEEAEKLEMIRYLMNVANEDGGWGMYVHGKRVLAGNKLTLLSAQTH